MDFAHTEIHHFGLLIFLICNVGITLSYPHYDEFQTPDNPSITYTYTRFPEIEKHCGGLISSAVELPPDDNRGERLKKELLFTNGDWDQESGGAPLMPFDSRELPSNTFMNGPPLKLASFWIMDVDPVRRAKNTVSVSGTLQISISRTDPLYYKPYDWYPKFYMQQGTTKMTVLFEGIYVETEENGGQYSMCLLGNATMGTSVEQMNPCIPGDPWNPCLLQVKNKPSTFQDDQIMLILHYPSTFTLTKRGITGEMKSLNNRGKPTYFDKVHISSQMSGRKTKYQFGSEELLSRACSPYPYQDSFLNDDIEMYKGDDYCEKLREDVWNEVFEFVSTRENAGKEVEKNKLGPFLLDKDLEAAAEHNNLDRLRLMIQELECEPESTPHIGGISRSAKVSAVLRVIQKSGYVYREEMRTGLSRMTLTAEGVWHSCAGQLCMIGCLGSPNGILDSCTPRITLYFPVTISLKQHSRVLGIITSLNGSESHHPLMFKKVATSREILNRFPWESQLKWSYNHTNIISLAKELRKRHVPTNMERTLRKLFFRYPSSKGDDIANFSFLADVLSVQVCAAPLSSADSETAKTYLEIVILSMGSLLGRYRSSPYQEKPAGDVQKVFHSASENIEISGHLSITGGKSNISFYFEGLFDPTIGEMYLIGCRDILEFQNFSNGTRDLDEDSDCMIDIKVQYSPRNARWLLNPNIKFSIISRRRKEDQLYFHPLNINGFVLSYEKKFEDIVTRKGVEEVLRLLLLAISIICIRGQSRCCDNQEHPTVYISLVMLGLQALGFSLPLIIGSEALFNWKEFTSYRSDSYQLEKHPSFQSLNFCIKILLLFALVEVVKLLTEVLDTRKMKNSEAKMLKLMIPSDKLVFLLTMLIHITGFLFCHGIRQMYKIPILYGSKNYAFGSQNMERLLIWWKELEIYCGGLVQDFFLLPQIIGNVFWGVQGKPLRKLYYVGFTMIRIVILVYDNARDPVPNPNGSEIEFQYLRVAFYARLGNMIISVLVVTLAIIAYIQQNTANQKCRQKKKLEECEDMDFKSVSYQRLLSE